MEHALAGKVALVTGGGWNIGRATSLRLAREGARVVLAGRRPGPLEETAAAIRAEGGTALAVPADVTDWGSVQRLVAVAEEGFGPIDALLALAGGGSAGGPFEASDPGAWAGVVAANLVGTYHAARAVVPGMRERGGGTIVTCGGGGASFPLLGVPLTAYASAKAAICRFTDQLAVELLESGIRVNCLLPGLTWSAAWLRVVEEEEQRLGRPHPERAANRPPEETAELAAWLASDASRPLTGRTVAPEERWWRDPAQVAAVQADLHAACLRRQAPV